MQHFNRNSKNKRTVWHTQALISTEYLPEWLRKQKIIKSITSFGDDKWTQERPNTNKENRLLENEYFTPREKWHSSKVVTDADWRVWSWPWQLFALRNAACHLFVTGIWCRQVKNALGWSTVMFCACKVIQFFCVVISAVSALLKFDCRLVINDTR